MKTLEDRPPIVGLGQAFGVSRSGYYRWRAAKPTARACEDGRLIVELKAWLEPGGPATTETSVHGAK